MSDQRSLPTTATFHPDEVERYVRDRIYLKNPVTWFGWVAGILAAGGGYAVIQLVELWMILAAVGGVGVSILSLGRDLSRRDSIRLEYLEELNRKLEGQAGELAEWLDGQFRELDHAQASGLLKRLQRHMTTFEEVLGQKFQPGTKTYEHFHGAAETLHIQTLNVLKDVATQIKVVGSIDIDGAKRDLARAPEGEKASHQRRIELHAEGTKRLSELLGTAESAVAGLAELKQEIAKIRSGDAEDFSKFLRNVGDLAERAGLYLDERTIS